MIQFKNIRLYRDQQLVLQDICLDFIESRIAIIGANGSGKSSLARLVNGLLLPQEGEVWVNALSTAKESKQIRSKVGFLFQNPEHQIVMPMVIDDVALSLKNQGITKSNRLQRAERILHEMGISHLSDRSSHMLSGGEKQLIALAGILIGNPDILVMDEPSTLLDLRHLNQLKKRIEQLAQQIIIITHEMTLARMCQRVIVLDEGRVVCDATPNEAIDFYQKKMTVL